MGIARIMKITLQGAANSKAEADEKRLTWETIPVKKKRAKGKKKPVPPRMSYLDFCKVNLREEIHRVWGQLEREDEIINAIIEQPTKIPHDIRAMAVAVEYELLTEALTARVRNWDV